MDAPVNNGINEIDGCLVAGYDGVDECDRTSVAMTNDHAGIGHGRREAYADPDSTGQLKLTANSGRYGFSTSRSSCAILNSTRVAQTRQYPRRRGGNFQWV